MSVDLRQIRLPQVRLPQDRDFVDTNVFIYAFDRSAEARKLRAEGLIEAICKSGSGV